MTTTITVQDTQLTVDGVTYDLAIWDRPQARAVYVHFSGELFGVANHVTRVFRGRPVRQTALAKGTVNFWSKRGWLTDEEMIRALVAGKPAKRTR